MTTALYAAGMTILLILLIDEISRAAYNRRTSQRVIDDTLRAGMRMGAAAERYRIMTALTEDTAEHAAVKPVSLVERNGRPALRLIETDELAAWRRRADRN